MCGFLVNTSAEWFASLRRLADDEELRQQMGQAGRAHAQAAYSYEIVAGLWHTLLVPGP